jgi:hypothetical protein
VLVDVPSSLMPHVRAGKIRALGMFSGKRVAGAPEVPTIAEAGGPAIEARPGCCSCRPRARRARRSAGFPPRSRASSPRRHARALREARHRRRRSTPEQAGALPRRGDRDVGKVITTAGIKGEQ